MKFSLLISKNRFSSHNESRNSNLFRYHESWWNTRRFFMRRNRKEKMFPVFSVYYIGSLRFSSLRHSFSFSTFQFIFGDWVRRFDIGRHSLGEKRKKWICRDSGRHKIKSRTSFQLISEAASSCVHIELEAFFKLKINHFEVKIVEKAQINFNCF